LGAIKKREFYSSRVLSGGPNVRALGFSLLQNIDESSLRQ
ncbi:MAG: hypothetical protein ACI9O0_001173, partial [Paracoccaceae bacterium]